MSSYPVLHFPAPGPRSGLEETEDAPARRAALNPEHSVLVQAPAGAGKTNLLTERFLALLARVEAPEQILAITFTRAATAEMRGRILGALAAAERGAPQPEPVGGLARAALAHSQALGWALLEQPHRLQVETIDSLCLRLAHGQPLLARLGGALAPSEDAGPLFREAARRTCGLLDGSGGPEITAALERVLLRRDNSLPEVETLLVGMLARRDAWLAALPLDFREDVNWEEVREVLEAPLAEANLNALNDLRRFFQANDELWTELSVVGGYAGSNLDSAHPLRNCTEVPETVEGWFVIRDLLLTQKDEWRKSWSVREGFPPSDKGSKAEKDLRQSFKQRMKDCCRELSEHPDGLRALLCRLRTLPPEHYTDDQWETLTAVLRLLRRAAGELRLVFAEQNAVDFVEIARAAEEVLRDEGSLRGLLESEQKQHILVDEFQDTSRAQHRLLALLVKEWTPGDGRTVFLVGDPLQSIYGFRQAEVALFHQTRDHGLLCGEDGRRLECNPLQLTHNFRSHGGLVQALNRRMEAVFADSSADRFVPAHAFDDEGPGFAVHATLGEDRDAAADEAAAVVAVLQSELPRVREAEARGEGEYRAAVLVRSRPHLRAILPALREAGIPYRAVDLETLGEQPEVSDAYALACALLHPADRRAWLTVLRAPWCGLGMADLHLLCGTDEPEAFAEPLAKAISARLHLLSPEGQARAGRVWNELEAALRTRYVEQNGLSLAAWVERTWRALGGPATVDGAARENVEAFWRLLDSVSISGVDILSGALEARLQKLTAAPDARVSERFGVQVMTIHKAKGLGFETVLLPGLERKPRADDRPLLAFLEREDGVLLAAPIGSKEEEADRLYRWVEAQKRERDAAERKRLFYVACTRARKRLHLFGTVERDEQGGLRTPAGDSLLGAAWAGLRADFEAAAQTRPAPEPAVLPALAASAAAGGNPLERLPADWSCTDTAKDMDRRAQSPAPALFPRQEGSTASRARGVVIHALMEALAKGSPPEQLPALARRSLRSAGAPETAADELTTLVLRATQSAAGQWILAAHPEAAAESAFQLWDRDGNLRTLRVDRTFLAGPEPGSAGTTHRWIVDYKTGVSGVPSEAWRGAQKALYGPQLELYGLTLGDARPLRCALFYPEIREAVWWDLHDGLRS